LCSPKTAVADLAQKMMNQNMRVSRRPQKKRGQQSERYDFWQTLGRLCAQNLAPTISNARIALEYVLQHESEAADRYLLDPAPSEVEQVFIAAFDAELSDGKPDRQGR